METQPGIYQTPAPPPNWISRSWKWLIPVAVVGFILLAVGFVSGILLIVETSFRHSDCYTQALARASADPHVLEKMGQPIVAGWLISGNINISGPSGNADISIPLSGPKGKGTIYVVAKKSAGDWSFETLQVEIEGQTQRIDLLKPESAPGES
jgi:hypothetical protein